MKLRFADILTFGFILLYTIAASLVALHRFWQYEVFYYDFGIFDQAIWNVSRFRAPIVDHYVIGGKVIFADHFSPSMFLLSPLYWITDRPEILLVAQAVAVGLSAVALYAIAKFLLRHRSAPVAVVFSYLLFVGTQNALIADIHEVTFMMLPLMLTFLAVIAKRMRLFWICFLITLGFKESSSLIGVGLAWFIYAYNRQWIRISVLVAALSVFWGTVTTQYIIPYFYGRSYFYTPSFDKNPLVVIATLFDSPIKRHTLLMSFAGFGFLPVFFPPMWPLILSDIAPRFMQGDFTLRWGMGLHYSAQMAVILAVASVFVLRSLERRFRHGPVIYIIPVLLMATSVYLHQFKLHGPLGLAYNPAFYAHTANFTFLNDLISRVPKGSTVMTSNNIAPHMIHTHSVYLLRDSYADYMPDYFVLDLRDGQNVNNFFGSNIEAVKTNIAGDTRYSVFYKNGDQIIYKRK